MATVEVHILSFNEREILPWTVDAYDRWADRIIVHDAFSTDGTRDAIKWWFPWVEIRDWDTGNAIRDDLAAQLKSNAGRQSDCQWTVAVDADEILYAPGPQPIHELLDYWLAQDRAVVRPVGYEMIADEMRA